MFPVNSARHTAAGKLAARYSPVVGCIRSWDGHKKCHYPVIIDNMMNLELLMVGYELFGCDSLKQIAVSHANTTMALVELESLKK